MHVFRDNVVLGGYLAHNNLDPLGVKNIPFLESQQYTPSLEGLVYHTLAISSARFLPLLRRIIPIPIPTNTLLFIINTLRCIMLRLPAPSCYLSARLLWNAKFSDTLSSHHHLQLDFYALEDIISITFNCKQPDFHRLVHA